MEHQEHPLTETLNDLARFGLDPDHWKFFPSSQKNDPTLLIKNRHDENFTLLGFLDEASNHRQFNEICLLSL